MRRAVLVVTLLAATQLAGVALADIPPSDTSGCNGKAAGEACKRDDGSAGACVKSTCSRNDYSNGPPPTQVQYECMRCGDAPPAEKKSCAAVPGETLVVLAALLGLQRRKS